MADSGSRMSAILEVDKSPSDEDSLKNCAIVSTTEPLASGLKPDGKGYVKVTRQTSLGVKEYYLTLATASMNPGRVGLSGIQREWLHVSLKNRMQVERVQISKMTNLIGTISLEVDFYSKPKKAQPSVNTDDLAPLFSQRFGNSVFCAEQMMVLGFDKMPLMKATVLEIIAEDVAQLRSAAAKGSKKIKYGILHAGSRVIFEKKAESTIQLIGRHKGDSAHVSIISPDWDFEQMGIGGLKKEFSDIFRRAFASRVFPPEVVEQLGMKHVRGILLFGPPGTGKTLMARQIGTMLHAREPKIVNGPEVLDKYVGESEAKVRAACDHCYNLGSPQAQPAKEEK